MRVLESGIKISLLLVVLFLSIVLLGNTALADSATIGGRPANPRDDNPRSKSIFVYSLEPGQSVKDAVQIFNTTEEQKTILVYATDSVVSSGGAFACEQAAEPADDSGSWIKLSRNEITLAKQSSATVPFTVTIPKDVQPGEHNACIAIQEKDAAPAAVGNGIALNFRSAIRVAITVPGEINKQLTIDKVSLREQNGKIIGTVKLKNSGNVSLDTTVVASLKRLCGINLQTIEGTYPSLPGTVTELNFEYKKPYWGGLVRLHATGSYNSNTDNTLGEGSVDTTVNGKSGLIIIWPQPLAFIIILSVIGLLVALIYYLARRYYILPRQAKIYHEYIVKDGDNIQELAKKTNTNWRHLAHVNSIKAPYTLQEGSTIKLPNIPAQTKEPNQDIIKIKSTKTKANASKKKPIKGVDKSKKSTKKANKTTTKKSKSSKPKE